MGEVEAREVYEESKNIGRIEVVGRVVAFEQGWRTRHVVTVYKEDNDAHSLVYFVDALMACPSSTPEAVRHCIAAIDECVAQIERMQPQPAQVDTNDLPF